MNCASFTSRSSSFLLSSVSVLSTDEEDIAFANFSELKH
jgi:hypothetical protein